MYTLDHLVRMWATEQLTVEQIIGQVLLHLNDMKARLTVLEQQQPAQNRSDPPSPPDPS